MLNVIKMNFYRMIKSKSFYVTILLAAIGVMSSIIATKLAMDNMSDSVIEELQQDGPNVGVTIGSSFGYKEGSPIDEFIPMILGSGTIILLACIFCVIFVGGEHNTGFIKNIVSKAGYRNQMSVSHGFVMIVYSIIEYIVCGIAVIIVFPICFGSISVHSFSNIAVYLLLELLVQISLLQVCILVTNITRNIAISMAFGICLSSNLFGGILYLLNYLDLPFKVGDYLVAVIGRNLSIAPSNNMILRCVIMCMIEIIFCQGLSTWIIKKQDIK